MSHLDLKIHHGGVMHATPDCYYEGGEVSYYHSLNTETLKFHELDIMVKRLSERPVIKYHYRVPGQSMNTGLRICWPQALSNIIELAKIHKTYIEMYVEHGEEEEVVLEELNEENLKSDDDISLEDTDHADTDDDVASLDHVSDNENEEVVFFRQKKLQQEADKKKKGKSKKGQEEEGEEGIETVIEGDVENILDENVNEEVEVEVETQNGDDPGYVSDYADSDQGYGTPNYDSEDEEYEKKRKIKWPVFDPRVEWDKQEPVKGMLFANSYQLRNASQNTPQHGKKKKKAEVKVEQMRLSDMLKLAQLKKAGAAYQASGEGLVEID
ncbi:hypothetical protein OROMI_009906 [Orobanche minor]